MRNRVRHVFMSVAAWISPLWDRPRENIAALFDLAHHYRHRSSPLLIVGFINSMFDPGGASHCRNGLPDPGYARF